MNCGNFDVDFRYNQLNWTTGNASGGINGLGGTPAQAGYDAGDGVHFATLTDIITHAWSDKTTKEYKTLKGLKKENLRDNMTNTELILNMLPKHQQNIFRRL